MVFVWDRLRTQITPRGIHACVSVYDVAGSASRVKLPEGGLSKSFIREKFDQKIYHRDCSWNVLGDTGLRRCGLGEEKDVVAKPTRD